jgi:hypothetical protein
MKPIVAIVFGFVLLFSLGACKTAPSPEAAKTPIIFASYAEYPQQVLRSPAFCESVRTFAGSMNRAPIRFYYSEQVSELIEKSREELEAMSVELRRFDVPDEARRITLAGKPFAAAKAEADAAGEAEVLAFLDANILVLQEPRAFRLEPGTDFAYRPVMHRNIGSLYDEPPDAFWTRIYENLDVAEAALFPMEGIADKLVIRPYYNAGFLVVRPERRLLRKWAENFKICYQDPELVEMCRDEKHNVFLHQAALAGTVPAHLERKKTAELPPAYNYPLFFHKFYESDFTFDSLENVVSIKYEFDFNDLPADWDKNLKGPVEVIAWIKAHCAPEKEKEN